MYKATNNAYYLNYLGKNGDALGGTGWAMTEFGWDVKYAGVQTLVAKVQHAYATLPISIDVKLLGFLVFNVVSK